VKRGAVTTVLVVTLVMVSLAVPARGQEWSVEVSTGRLVYEPIAAEVATSNVMGSLRYDAARGTWVYGSAALPMRADDTLWAATGAGGRVSRRMSSQASLGADVGAHGFWFRDRVVALTGTGGTLEALPFVRMSVGSGFVEGGGGWRGQTLSYAGIRESRGVFETGVRGGYGGTFSVEGDARWVHAVEGTYPFVGVTVARQTSRVGVWGQAGKWLATTLDDRVWGAGAAASVGARTTVWGSVRQEGRDPLYWNTRRRVWSIGLTQQLGSPPPALAPVTRTQAGTVVVRMRASDAPAGPVSIAGDFNKWQAAPMQRDGAEWVVRLPLASGVYNYAFRSASGEWFVPASTPGRKDDGMGGHVAVLVVN
jgi:hypothetical protein